MKATQLKYARKYSDGSGDEFAVSADLDKGVVTIRSQSTEAEIPTDELSWFIDALQEVRSERDRK